MSFLEEPRDFLATTLSFANCWKRSISPTPGIIHRNGLTQGIVPTVSANLIFPFFLKNKTKKKKTQRGLYGLCAYPCHSHVPIDIGPLLQESKRTSESIQASDELFIFRV